jgi:hypothetical protein
MCGIVAGSHLHRRGLVVGILWTHFALGFSALFPLVNPLGSALVFLGLVGLQPAAVYKSLARQIAINMVLFFAVIELIGSFSPSSASRCRLFSFPEASWWPQSDGTC